MPHDAPASTVRAFVVTIPTGECDLASDRLWQLGVRAIEERCTDSAEVLELWTSVGADDQAVAGAASTLDVKWTWRVEDVPAAPADTWRRHARAIAVTDRLMLVPAWVDVDDVPGVVRVRIEPMGAFGLGDHPTTHLSAAVLALTIEARSADGATTSLLDVGCGTGVLSIAAALMGARPVCAIDISAEAVAATALNARANAVEDVIEVSSVAFADVCGTYDIVVANILAPVLIAAASDLRRLTAIDGTLIVSGILADAHDHVIAALAPMKVTETRTTDGWAVLTLRHR
jgi:ribosomal protein L11 methyltransferase